MSQRPQYDVPWQYGPTSDAQPPPDERAGLLAKLVQKYGEPLPADG